VGRRGRGVRKMERCKIRPNRRRKRRSRKLDWG
jgi:hypothetical protein